MRIPKHSVRWALIVVGLATVWFFVQHPFEIVSGIAGVLFFIAAWYVMFGSQRRSPERKGKDRTFRHPPWVR
jgi:hypothetical protein